MALFFCRNFVNKGFCYGLGCKFLHVSRDIERQYKRTGKLPNDLVNEWNSIQAKLMDRNPNVCQDQLQSKCFRPNCKFGIHHVFRTDMDAGNIVEFSFRPSSDMIDYIQNIYGAPKPYWSSDVLCHIRTPFSLLADHIMNVLKPFKINGNQISFNYNDKKIDYKDVNITPLSLDIGNGVDVFVDIAFTNDSLADIECPICYSTIVERCYNFPCNHLFCINCSLKWFFNTNVRTFNYDEERFSGCPLCRSQVEQFHFKLSNHVITVDHRFLSNMSDDELFDWTSLHLKCGFRRTREHRDPPVNYFPAGFGGY